MKASKIAETLEFTARNGKLFGTLSSEESTALQIASEEFLAMGDTEFEISAVTQMTIK